MFNFYALLHSEERRGGLGSRGQELKTQETRVFPDNKEESWGWCGVRATGCLTYVAPHSVQIRDSCHFLCYFVVNPTNKNSEIRDP